MKMKHILLLSAMIVLLLFFSFSACTNVFMEKILGVKGGSDSDSDSDNDYEEGPYTGPPVVKDGSNDVFIVHDVTTLNWVGTGHDMEYNDEHYIWSLDAHYLQVRPIDLTSEDEWTPIGSDSYPFTGSYNVDKSVKFPRTITGLRFNAGSSNQGMFGYIDSGDIINVSLINVEISGNVDGIGGIAGYNDGGMLYGCTVSGSIAIISNSSKDIGGVVGTNSGSVVNCSASAKVLGSGTTTSAANIGGIVGYNDGGEVTGCSASGEISGSGWNSASSIGGIVGYNDGGEVTNCYASGMVSGSSSTSAINIGGVVGNNSNGIIEKCYATGAVEGIAAIGGVAGYNNGGEVRKCYSTSDVTGTGNNIGGVVGSNTDTVRDCYATGSITGSENVGGVVGTIGDSGAVYFCYATGSVSGEEYVGGVIGYHNTGTVQDCVALNVNIKTNGSTIQYGRVAGFHGTLINNYGREDMKLNGSPYTWPNTGAGDSDGDDVPVSLGSLGSISSTCYDPDFWFGLSWDWDSGIWDKPNYPILPTLRNVSGRNQNPRIQE